MLSRRQKAEAEAERIQRHLRRIGKKSYRHLHIYINKMDRVVVYYTRTKPKTEIKAHPIKDPPGFHAEYWRIRDGGPNGGGEPLSMRRAEGSHAEGTWNAAFDVIEKSSDLASKKSNTKRAYLASLKTARIALGNMLMAKTKPYEVEQFVDECAANKLNVVNVLTVLKKAYLIGHQRDWTSCDLMAGVHLPKTKKRADDETFYRPYEPWEVTAWRKTHEVGTMARLCFELAFNQTLPRSDVIRIAPCHIGINEDGERVITGLARRKTGVAYNSVITSPELIECLDAYPVPAEGDVIDRQGRSSTPFLRKKRSGQPYVEWDKIGDDDACQRGANLIGQDWRKWAAAAGVTIRLHAARHTFALDAAEAEVDGRGAAWTMGQTDQRTHNKYKQDRDARIAGQNASRKVALWRQRRDRLRLVSTNAG